MKSKLLAAKRYQEKFLPKAEKLFTKIFPVTFFIKDTANILIIGAGRFPSYQALLHKLRQINPDLKKISFTLVEPISSETDFFLENFADSANDFAVYNADLQHFLKEYKGGPFDIIYFEHPETMTLPIVLSHLGMSSFKRTTALREAIPALTAVTKAGTLIIASCMSRHELKQLQTLLNFSLKIKPRLMSSHLLHIFYGGPYCEGLSYLVKQPAICPLLQKKKIAVIRLSNVLLSMSLFIALIIYILYCGRFPDPEHSLERLLAILLMGAQLYWHRPGTSGLIIKLLLLGAPITFF